MSAPHPLAHTQMFIELHVTRFPRHLPATQDPPSLPAVNEREGMPKSGDEKNRCQDGEVDDLRFYVRPLKQYFSQIRTMGGRL